MADVTSFAAPSIYDWRRCADVTLCSFDDWRKHVDRATAAVTLVADWLV